MTGFSPGADRAGAQPATSAAPATARGRRRREELLDAAEQLFLDQGFHGTSVDDLGAAAGISGPGLYRHFASKDALLMAVLDRIWAQLRPAIDTAAGQEPDEALTTLLEAQLELAMGQPSALVLLVRELRHLDLEYRRLAARNHRRYVDAWVDALRRRTPHLTDEDARSTVLAVHGLIDSVAINPEARHVAQRRDWLRELATAVVDRAAAD
ncbi:MAG TPA: TetR/AcrR family transcriptional regulator [Egicoccus sp.]|nr:TetR/AcrR family transcriptional regulator [Egicoccus sp.]HSK23958.1 TetR/AcrR family transcriptional regulator [Egicoccus sp.]